MLIYKNGKKIITTMITHLGQKFLSESSEVVEITYFSENGVGYKHYGEINNIRYNYTEDGKAYAILGRSNDHHNLNREITPQKDPEYFL